MRLPRNLSTVLTSEDKVESPKNGDGRLDDLASLSSSGPLNSSARVAILSALLVIKRATFTELMLAVGLPKSSLNLSLAVLQENKFVTVRKGFVQFGGPRTIVEITSQGEKAIKDYLIMMQELAKKLLPK
jgi:DNA-binding transcriptional ArsR family regulator